MALAKPCVQGQLSNEAAGESVEYGVEGGGMLATYRHLEASEVWRSVNQHLSPRIRESRQGPTITSFDDG